MSNDSRSPSSITTSKYGLEFSTSDFTSQRDSIRIVKSDDDTYSAIGSGDVYRKPTFASVDNIVGSTSLDPQTALMTNASLRNIEIGMDRVDPNPGARKNPENSSILSDDPITKFYVCSIYVLGLYIFYRILVTQP